MQSLEKIPKPLLELKNPVKKLYYKGNIELLNRPLIAVIGSRRMNTYTKNCVLNLCASLKNHGVVVISGAAIGVDIYAAKAALPNTIAVFANGLDSIYPAINAKIIKEIYENALALSENKPDYKPRAWDFLLRNRLIIALSKAVVIAQADFRSGSMQSARLARELKKELFVLPQRLGESEGTNALLKEQKARLITDFTSFAQQFGKSLEEDDEILSFIKKGAGLEAAISRFGMKIYEYELEGKIMIEGTKINVC